MFEATRDDYLDIPDDIKSEGRRDAAAMTKEQQMRFWLECDDEAELFQSNTSYTEFSNVVESYATRETGRVSVLYEYLQNAIDYNDWEQGTISLDIQIGTHSHTYLQFLKLKPEEITSQYAQATAAGKEITITVGNFLRQSDPFPPNNLIDFHHKGKHATLGMHGIGSKAAGAAATASNWVEAITFASVDEQGQAWKAVGLMGTNQRFEGVRYNVGLVNSDQKTDKTLVTLRQPDLKMLLAIQQLPDYFLPMNPNYRNNVLAESPLAASMVDFSVALQALELGEEYTEGKVKVWHKAAAEAYFSTSSMFGFISSETGDGLPVFSEHPRLEIFAHDTNGKRQKTIMVDGLKLELPWSTETILPLAVWGFGHQNIDESYRATRSQDSKSLSKLSVHLVAQLYGSCTNSEVFAKLAQEFIKDSRTNEKNPQGRGSFYNSTTVVEHFRSYSSFTDLVASNSEVQTAIKAGMGAELTQAGYQLDQLQVTTDPDKFNQALNLKLPIFFAPSEAWQTIFIDVLGCKKVNDAELFTKAEQQAGTMELFFRELNEKEMKNESIKVAKKVLLQVLAFGGSINVKDGKIQLTFTKELPLSFRAPSTTVTMLDNLDPTLSALVRDCLELIVEPGVIDSFKPERDSLFSICSRFNEEPENRAMWLSDEKPPEYKMVVLSAGEATLIVDRYQQRKRTDFTNDHFSLGTQVRKAPHRPAGLEESDVFIQINLDHPTVKDSFFYLALEQLVSKLCDPKSGEVNEEKLFNNFSEASIKDVTRVYEKLLQKKAEQLRQYELSLGLVLPPDFRGKRKLRVTDDRLINDSYLVQRVSTPMPLVDEQGKKLIDTTHRRDIEALIENKLGVPLEDADKTVEYHLARLHELGLAAQKPDIEPCNMQYLPKYLDANTVLYNYYFQRDGQSWNMAATVPLEHHASMEVTKPGLRLNLPVMTGTFCLARFPGMKPTGFYHPDPELATEAATYFELHPDDEGYNYSINVKKKIPEGLVIFYEQARENATVPRTTREDDLDMMGFDLSKLETEAGNRLFANEDQRVFFEKLKNNRLISEKQKVATVLYFWFLWFKYKKEDGEAQTPYSLRTVASRAVREGTGICYEAAAGLALLLRSVGIPSRMVNSCAGGYNGFFPTLGSHVVLDALMDNQWVTLEPQLFKGSVLSHDFQLPDVPRRLKNEVDALVRPKGISFLRRAFTSTNQMATVRGEGEVRQDVMRVTEVLEKAARSLAGSKELLDKVGKDTLIEWAFTILSDKQAIEAVADQRVNQMGLREKQELKAVAQTLDDIVRQIVVNLRQQGLAGLDEKMVKEATGLLDLAKPVFKPAKLTLKTRVGIWFAQMANRLLTPEVYQAVPAAMQTNYTEQMASAATMVEEGVVDTETAVEEDDQL